MHNRTINLAASVAGVVWLLAGAAGARAQDAGELVGPVPTPVVMDARERSKMLERSPLVGGGVGAGDASRAAPTPTSAPTRPSSEGQALGVGANASGRSGGFDTGSVGTLLSMALPLGAVIAMLVGCLVILKRVMGTSSSLAAALGPGGRAPGGVIEVLGRYPVAKGQLLVLIKLDRRVLLVGHSSPGRGVGGTGGGFSTLCEITEPEEVAAVLRKVEDGEGKSAGARFGALLQRKVGFGGAGDRASNRDTGAMELGLHEVAPSRGRRVQRSEDGDVVEMWDERSAGASDLLAEFEDPARGAVRSGGERDDSYAEPARAAYAESADAERLQRDAGGGSDEPLSFAQIRQRIKGLQGRGLNGGRGGVA